MIVQNEAKTVFGEPVFLNIYYLWRFGFGFYHSDIQVYGTKYQFGVRRGIATFRLRGKATSAEPSNFKQSIFLGYTYKTLKEVKRLISDLRSSDFSADKYNVITHNCNDFSDAFATLLIGHGIPEWVNRMAHFGKRIRLQRWIPKRWLSPDITISLDKS